MTAQRSNVTQAHSNWLHSQGVGIVHLKKGTQWDPGLGTRFETLASGLFAIQTCQRLLWVGTAVQIELLAPSIMALANEHQRGIEVLTGSGAYEFLLRFSTGLESAVLGEANVFGQVKQAWADFEIREPSFARGLTPWIQRVFEDTKSIRTEHLKGVDAGSYGSLARSILGERKSTLMIGAGQMARSVAPLFLESPLWIANRTLANAIELRDRCLKQKPGASVHVVESFDFERSLWSQVDSVVIATPWDEFRDPHRIDHWIRADKKVLHMGLRGQENSPWHSVKGLMTLDHLFELSRSKDEFRTCQANRAAKACRERAELRLLGQGNISIPHGWEDLALFG